MKKYIWNENQDDEVWQHETFDTKEECIEDAYNYDLNKGDVIYIGEIQAFSPYVIAEDVLDRIEDCAYEECGEAAECGFVNYKDQESLDKLSEKLTDCVNEWLKETDQEPTFCKIVNISAATI